MPALLHLESLKDPSCRPFVDAWLRWRGDALLPSRDQLDLNEIRRALAMVSLLEIKSPDEVIVRVAGSGLTPFKGFDFTGMNLAQLTPAADWPVRRYRLDCVVRHPCGGALVHDVRQDGQLLHSVAMIVLPLLPPAAGGNPLALLQMVRTDEPGMTPAEPQPAAFVMPDEFGFVDIGAGVPDSTEPT